MKNWKKTFYTIWIGQAFSQLTSSILQFAIVWYLTDKTGSGMILSLAMLMGFLPQGVLGPFIGVYIDRFSRKKIMIIADLGIAAVSLLLVGGFLKGDVSVGLILVVLLLRAIGTAFHTPTLQAVTPQLVPPDQLTRCAGYSQSLESISLILSPAIAGILYSQCPMAGIVILDVIGAVLAVALLGICKIPEYQRSEKMTEKIRVIKEASEGFHILRQNKGIFGLVLVGVLYTIALMPISALFPLMSKGYFHGTTADASLVEIVFAVGFLLGSIILGKWGGTKNKVYTMLLSYILMAGSLLGTAVLPDTMFPAFLLFSGIMGISGPFYWGMYTPILQQNFREEYLGRVLSITSSIRFLAGVSALMVAGTVSEIIGEEKWFLVAGLLIVAAAAVTLLVKPIRNCDVKTNKTSI